MIAVLVIVSALSGGVLALVSEALAPQIAANEESARREAVFAVVPGAASYEEVKADNASKPYSIFVVKGSSGEPVGYAFECSGTGFQAEIKLMVGASSDMRRLTGMAVLASSETPGLGDKIKNPPFSTAFNGLDVGGGLRLVKNRPSPAPGEVNAITGATISSSAVISMISQRLGQVTEFLGRSATGGVGGV